MKNTTRVVTIYGLYDPREPDAVRYIGFSAKPAQRLNAHIKEAQKSTSNNHRLNWIRSLLAQEVMPSWRSLDEISSSLRDAAQREIDLISHYRADGHNLTNGTNGGDGSVLWTPQMSSTRSVLSSRYWADEANREKHREAMKAVWASQRGDEWRETQREISRQVQLGRRRTPETKEKMRLRKLGKPHARTRTPEWNAKIAAAQAGKPRRPWTDKERARHMAGMNHKKMSASAKARRIREHHEDTS